MTSDKREFSGKVAVVSGAASGIGKEIACLLAERGAKVVIGDKNAEGATCVADTLRAAGCEAIAVDIDVSKHKDAEKLVATAVDVFGALHLAVNNAAISGERVPVADQSIEGWRSSIDTNLNSIFYALKYQIAAMLASGHGGAIVNVASIFGSVAGPHSPSYVAAKHGVVGLTKSAALAYARKGLRINSLGPGYIDTPMLSILDPETRKALEQDHPIGRIGKPREVAELALFLLSDRASFITGSYHLVDGGYTAK